MVLRLAFMGTPEFSVPTLQALLEAGHEIVAVYTQPPRPAGRRGLALVPSPVAVFAQRFGLPVFTPTRLRPPEQQALFESHKLDAAVVIAYGLLLPQAILDAPRWGCFNAHASLLPRWRGAAPIQRAIMAGDSHSGVMIMQMEAGLDTGPVVGGARVKIEAGMTSGQLHEKLAVLAADLMVKTMSDLERGDLHPMPQAKEGVLYANKIEKAETRIDWARSSDFIVRQICGLSPSPASWCEMLLGDAWERVKILGAKRMLGASLGAGYIEPQDLIIHCGEGRLAITSLQRAGGKVLDAEQFLRGAVINVVR
ncbi:methionyl-tRNA formyltransferase [Bartonella sp. DGB2]|uniref:methionyl-tRNA formyltransferase n=1 Tax=Bartonella sp. DGB2 TaxID=3388426 RepID=UPI0039902C3A